MQFDHLSHEFLNDLLCCEGMLEQYEMPIFVEAIYYYYYGVKIVGPWETFNISQMACGIK